MQTLSSRFAINRLRDRRGRRRSVASRDATRWTSHFDLMATSQCLLHYSTPPTNKYYDPMRGELSISSKIRHFLRVRSRNCNLPDIFPRQSLAIHLKWVQKSAEFTLVFAKLKPHCMFNCAVQRAEERQTTCAKWNSILRTPIYLVIENDEAGVISKLNQRGTCKLGELQKQWFVHMY